MLLFRRHHFLFMKNLSFYLAPLIMMSLLYSLMYSCQEPEMIPEPDPITLSKDSSDLRIWEWSQVLLPPTGESQE